MVVIPSVALTVSGYVPGVEEVVLVMVSVDVADCPAVRFRAEGFTETLRPPDMVEVDSETVPV